ncbi:hypothetical protein CLCR_03059 [Cladophialophora carrionii]|uniref:AB hydrolase-1 domain-containing protein n=1 Tax=Cladophialophora carrionii TaxID=86049 RepID=A0A1C1D295_9EURO|nr:hypothetical protein CLCR_03059 [Cladophialophora carrionii]
MSNPSTQATTHTVEVNGYTFSYRESGHGEPLVLLHGHISDQRAWDELEPKLATRFHVYNYSRRFAWPNRPIRDDERCPWEQDALDLAALIERWEIGPVHVLANSSGAVISLYTAKTNPQLFRTLMVEEPPLVGLFLPSLPPPLPALLSFLVWHPITFWPVMHFGMTTTGPVVALCKQGNYEEATEKFCSGVINAKYWPRLQRNPDRKRQVEDNAKWLCHFFRYSTMPKYGPGDAQRLEVPTLVMAGKESTAHQRYTAAELYRLVGAAKKEIADIDEAAHLMHEDNPDRVFDEVVRFVFEDAAE